MKAQTLTAGRQSRQVQAMLDHTFTRLSEAGALRLEGIRDEVHGMLVSAVEVGLSAQETADVLSARFTQYSNAEFKRLARTEAALAAEEAIREQLKAVGVRRVKWLIGAAACPICQGYAGLVMNIDDVTSLPPGHPNCQCSCVPAEE